MLRCRCGSTTHQRTSSNECVLNKKRIAKRSIDIPTEVMVMILDNLPVSAATPLGQVSRSWRNLVSSRHYWERRGRTRMDEAARLTPGRNRVHHFLRSHCVPVAEFPWDHKTTDLPDVQLYAYAKHGGPPGVTAAHLKVEQEIEQAPKAKGLRSPAKYVADNYGFPDLNKTIAVVEIMHVARKHANEAYEGYLKGKYRGIRKQIEYDTWHDWDKNSLQEASDTDDDNYVDKSSATDDFERNWEDAKLCLPLNESPVSALAGGPSSRIACTVTSVNHNKPPIPTEIVIMILDNLPTDAAVPLGQVSRSWRDLVSSKDYWKRRSWEPRKKTLICGRPDFEEDLALQWQFHRLLLAKHCVCVDDSEELQFRDWDSLSLENVQRIAFIKHGGPPGVTAAQKIFKALKAEKEQEIDQAIRERGLPSPAKYVVGNDHLPDFEKTIGIAEKTHIVHKHASGVYERKRKGTYGGPLQSDDDDDIDATDDYGEEDYDYSDDFVPGWPPGDYGEEDFNYSDDLIPSWPAGNLGYYRRCRAEKFAVRRFQEALTNFNTLPATEQQKYSRCACGRPFFPELM
ncbi:hypothetical protein BDZ88DRAFT_450445 [Geranomyces variabilis]|nr:hypothetical protein BDZ88DRAFT_450445 [Geranomyces variabilis]KAJ3134927.1 hypothetical protein HDU90_004252 [Geranomyces variabilis]